jgi:CheY-like chemotaxis protein
MHSNSITVSPPTMAPFAGFEPARNSEQRTLLLVDDHELVRCGIKALYTELQSMPLRWLEASSLQEAMVTYGREPHIDVVLLDLNLADCKGLQCLRQFIREFPAARIVVFSANQDEFAGSLGVPLWDHGICPQRGGALPVARRIDFAGVARWQRAVARRGANSRALPLISILSHVRPRGRTGLAATGDPGAAALRGHPDQRGRSAGIPVGARAGRGFAGCGWTRGVPRQAGR